jgi:hypothetical protein
VPTLTHTSVPATASPPTPVATPTPTPAALTLYRAPARTGPPATED